MELAVNIAVYGISYGFVLFIASIGLSIAIGMLGIVNVAHGALLMLGGYVGIAVLDSTGSWLLGLIAATLASGIASIIINEALLRHLWKQELQQILLTFGIVYMIGNICLWVWGAQTKVATIPSLINGEIHIGGMPISVYRLVVILIGIAIFVILWLVQEKTKVGTIIRAGMDDPEMLAGMGYNLRPITLAAFGVGLALAGMAAFVGSGVLGGVSSWMGPSTFFLSMVIVIVGGVGYVQGTLSGALLIGLLYVAVAAFFPRFSIISTYVAMIVVLLFRPRGLLGRKW